MMVLMFFVQVDVSLGSLSWDLSGLLQLGEEEDDATSGLPAPKLKHDVMQESGCNMVLKMCGV